MLNFYQRLNICLPERWNKWVQMSSVWPKCKDINGVKWTFWKNRQIWQRSHCNHAIMQATLLVFLPRLQSVWGYPARIRHAILRIAANHLESLYDCMILHLLLQGGCHIVPTGGDTANDRPSASVSHVKQGELPPRYQTHQTTGRRLTDNAWAAWAVSKYMAPFSNMHHTNKACRYHMISGVAVALPRHTHRIHSSIHQTAQWWTHCLSLRWCKLPLA